LTDDCYVLHSLGLTNHETKIWGECDFVVVSTGGIFVLEIKGGGVSCEKGEWLFTNSSGKVFRKNEGPFEQAKEAMFAVRRFVEKQDELKGFLYGYGVIMPDETFTHESPEIEQGVLLDRRDFQKKLDRYIQALGDFWREDYARKHDRPPRLPAKNELAAIRQALRPEIKTVYTLNSSLEKTGQDQIELTGQQCRVLRGMDGNPRTIVRGGAGTGKTVLALDKAVRLAEGGRRVLYLCYNRLLGLDANRHAATNVEGGALEAWSIHAWFDRVIDEAGERNTLGEAGDDMEEYYSHRYPNVYMDSLLKLGMKPFDAVVVDEAQDLLKEPYLDAIDLSLEGGLGEGRWHFFMDEEQDIFHAVENSALKRLNEYSHARFDLTVNCRNTREIIRAISRISGVPMDDEGAVDGPEPKVVYYRDGADEVAKVSRVVGELLGDGIPAKDIILLSGHRLEKSSFAGVEKIAGFKLRDISHDSGEYMKSIDFCTIQAFKGLERKVVIAVDLLALDKPVGQRLHYCGLSRARTMLVVMLGEGEEGRY
jgi:hypothetical protein